MSNIALKIEHLYKEYKDFSLEDVNIEIPQGAIMGLIGQNGAGKTTIIREILNIVTRKSGKIEVFGLDNIDDEVEAKNLIGYVADEDFLQVNSNLHKYELCFKSLYTQWDDTLFKTLVEKWKLPLTKRFNTYSKGMKRKAMIALALAHKPKLLILDEPTAGLDPVARIEVLDILRDFVADGENSVLFSTHITGDLDKVADYVTMIIDGKIKDSMSIDKIEEKYAVITVDNDKLSSNENLLIGCRKGNVNTEALILRENAKYFEGAQIHVPNIEQILVFNIYDTRNER